MPDIIDGKVTIHFNVPLIPQPTKQSCWAAAMAMVLSYKKKASISPETLANQAGGTLQSSYSWEFLQAVRDRYGFQSVIDVPADTCMDYEPEQWKEWLEDYGPLWFTFIWPDGGSHAMVLTGINGDLSYENTFVEINNPWNLQTAFDDDPIDFNPTNLGSYQNLPFTSFLTQFSDFGYDVEHASYRIMYLP